MIYVEASDDTIDARVKRVCAPLFATEQFLQGGHHESVTSATVTFVQFEGSVYAVTCHHVLSAFFNEAVKSGRRLVPSIHSGRSLHTFGSYGTDGKYHWSFLSCRQFAAVTDVGKSQALATLDRANADKPDIAIANVTQVWPTLQTLRQAEAIDLDAWTAPDWTTAHATWIAYGFPDGHKYRAGDQVAAPMPRVAVELSSLPPSAEKPVYTLCSTLTEEHGWGFSGLSGGPVLTAHTADERYAFVGITFEGAPSTKEIQETAESFIGKKDIVLTGYHLTPHQFKAWLAQRGHEVVLG